MPNPLTDELSADAKAELAAIFADLKRRFDVREADYPWREEERMLNALRSRGQIMRHGPQGPYR
jgi:hypothetical protein